MRREIVFILACLAAVTLLSYPEETSGETFAEEALPADAPALAPDTQTVERLRAAVSAELTKQLDADLSPEEAEVHRRLLARNRELLARQRKLEYEDPIASGIKTTLIAARRQVEALRQSLQIRLDAIEEIQEIEAERRDLMKQLQELRTKTRAEKEKTDDR